MLEMLGRSSNHFSTRHTGPGCLRGPLLILSPSACATVAHLFPSRSLPRTRKDGVRDAGFPSSSLPRTRKDGARDAGFLLPPTTVPFPCHSMRHFGQGVVRLFLFEIFLHV